jgi:hypothetical protein
MDPYLEDPGLWPDVHHEIIGQARAFLTQAVGPNYYVRIEERVYVLSEDDPGKSLLIPDIRIGERPQALRGGVATPSGTTLQVAEPETFMTSLEVEVHETHLVIHDRKDHGIVTVLEVVSPSNKIAGSEGRRSYEEKRSEILHSPSHWVEIDLLRRGRPVVPGVTEPYDYIVHVSRAGKRPKGQVWRIFLAQRLPVVAIPLRSGDPDVSLDIQQVLETAYDRAAYGSTVDYRGEPEVALTAEQAAWADELLRSKGLR